MEGDWVQRLNDLAQVPILLVATDFDGTIAPIVSDPATAEADREALVALKTLSSLPQTHVAVISGRSLSDLAGRTRDLQDAHLIGSHGSEYDAGFATALTPEAASLRARLAAYLSTLSEKHVGLTIEEKPAAFALHYRNADAKTAAAAVDAVLGEAATWPGVHVRHGKMVVELSAAETNKGVALRRIRQRIGATAALFVGDDVTDEDAFATLAGPDLGIKIGDGDSGAALRLSGIGDVARTLAFLAERRTEWLAGSHATPIERHSLLSDQRTIALLDPRARVVWMCLPRIDSPALFAELLGGPTAGYFEVAPESAEAHQATQRYVGDSLVLETSWPTMRVTDYLDCGGGRAFQRAGRTDLVRVIEGSGRVRIVFSPRLDFGRNETLLSITDQGVTVEGALDSIVLCSPKLPWRLVQEGRHQSAVAVVDLTSDPLVLDMRYGTASFEPSQQAERKRRSRSEQFWSSWAATLTPPKLAREQVVRSALLLKALCYGPTGAIAAAATTSLPEHVGGVRNWDYRYCWPRDAAMAGAALLRLGAPGPGLKLLDWLLGIFDRSEPGSLLSPLYSVTGGHIGAEGEIAELTGYRGSRPVRVGNAASQQVQLDVFGPIAELVGLLAGNGAALSAEHWRLIDAMVTAVERRWREPDHGIWEVRRPRQHHVHSKVMCWQTVDRAVRVARYLGRKRPDWIELREQIAADVLSRGWNPKRQAFCATYDDGEADASALCVGLSGLLEFTDPRFVSTVQFVERELTTDSTVYRYRYDDGLPGVEGGFGLCTTWLIQSYAGIGRRDAAERLFSVLLERVGPTGLLPEEYDPEEQRGLGNFPQAYSHLGLINAALCLEQATP
ncbi:MAG: trehalose-phosphatase, partial [Planctomycetes bacterium]|nr:trehalose-phosphatase [Planctomycetota bacterium]